MVLSKIYQSFKAFEPIARFLYTEVFPPLFALLILSSAKLFAFAVFVAHWLLLQSSIPMSFRCLLEWFSLA